MPPAPSPNGHLANAIDRGWIGALQRANVSTGFGDTTAAQSYSYDLKGRPHLLLHYIEDDPAGEAGKWFYRTTAYDVYSRPQEVTHFWRPAGNEDPENGPAVWHSHALTVVIKHFEEDRFP